jgi:hypothetical protein
MVNKEQLDEEFKAAFKEKNLSKTSIEIALEVYKKLVDVMSKYKDLMKDPELGATYQKKVEQEVILLLAEEMDMSYYEGMMAASMKLMGQVMAIPQIKKMNDAVNAKIGDSPELKDALKEALGKMGVGSDSAPNDPFSGFSSFRSKKGPLN